MTPTLLADPCRSCIAQLSDIAVAELRSDHAGETGAVYIYRGILALSNDAQLRSFAQDHLHTENLHLATIEQLLPPQQQSKCLPLWRVAGWSLGALCATGGRRFSYATIRAVETFVVAHYQQQLPLFPQPLRRLLERFCNDEAHHRDEANAALHTSAQYRLWHWTVAAGSALAVQLARRL